MTLSEVHVTTGECTHPDLSDPRYILRIHEAETEYILWTEICRSKKEVEELAAWMKGKPAPKNQWEAAGLISGARASRWAR